MPDIEWTAVGVVSWAVSGYCGLRERLDGILHELREIRTPSEGKDYQNPPTAKSRMRSGTIWPCAIIGRSAATRW